MSLQTVALLAISLISTAALAVPDKVHCEVVSGNTRRGSLEMVLDGNGTVTKVIPNLVVAGKPVPTFSSLNQGSSYGRIATRKGNCDACVSTHEVNASGHTGQGINYTSIFLRAPAITQEEASEEYFDRNFVTQLFGLTRNVHEYGILKIANPTIREYQVLCSPRNSSVARNLRRNNSSRITPRGDVDSSGSSSGRSTAARAASDN